MADGHDGRPSLQFQVSENIPPSIHQDLKDALERFHSYKTTLLESYHGVIEMFDKFYEILGETDPVTIKIKNEIETELMPVNHLKRDPIILISGQVNSGKSSLINEILGTSLVPVESTPCTSRIVKIKYSEESFYQIFDRHGKAKSEQIPYGRKKAQKMSLWNEIKLRSHDGVDPEFGAEETIVIGMKSDILKFGIQIVDTPGMSENKTLDKIVQECLDGVLQILIYVIDANPELREVDDKFLNYIIEKAPNMKILFVCNKCEENEDVEWKDLPTPHGSDDDEEEERCGPRDYQDGDVDIAAVETRLPKGESVFRKLKDRGHLLRDQDLATCDHFFRISCTAIRSARHGRTIGIGEEAFVQEFQRFLTHTVIHFQDCIKEHLFRTATTLYALATRAFDFFMLDKIQISPVLRSLEEKINATKLKEKDTVSEIMDYIANQKDVLHESIRRVIDGEKKHIIEESAKLDLKIDSSKKWTVHTTKTCRERLKAFLFQKLSEVVTSTGAVNEIFDTIEKNVTAKIRELYDECRKLGGHGDIQTQLESCYNVVILFPVTKSDSLLKFTILTRIRFAVENQFFYISPPSDEEKYDWKKNTTRKLLVSVVTEKLVDEICGQLAGQIKSASRSFLKIIAMIEVFYQTQNRDYGKRLCNVPFPQLSRTICTLRAVNSEILYGESQVVLLELINKVSSRSDIFRCTYRGEMAAARRARGADEIQHDMFAKQINFARLLPLNHRNIQQVLDVYRDKAGILYAIVPYIEDNLFRMLCESIAIPLRDRLHIAYQIVQACVFVVSTGFRVSDLRPNNVMMNKNVPVLNLLKPPSLETPYPPPDGMPQFHSPPDFLRGCKSNCNNDTYGCALLIWWLAIGKFVRPKFADTTDFQAIKTVITDDFQLVRMDINYELGRSTARRSATGVDAEMLDAVEKLLDVNIHQQWNNRMDIHVLLSEMERILMIK